MIISYSEIKCNKIHKTNLVLYHKLELISSRDKWYACSYSYNEYISFKYKNYYEQNNYKTIKIAHPPFSKYRWTGPFLAIIRPSASVGRVSTISSWRCVPYYTCRLSFGEFIDTNMLLMQINLYIKLCRDIFWQWRHTIGPPLPPPPIWLLIVHPSLRCCPLGPPPQMKDCPPKKKIKK